MRLKDFLLINCSKKFHNKQVDPVKSILKNNFDSFFIIALYLPHIKKNRRRFKVDICT